MTADELLGLLERRGALLKGHFRLSSGLHSDRFVQKFRIFEDPRTTELVCNELAGRLQAAGAHVVVSAAIGGIIPGFVVAKALGVRDIFVERESGKPLLRRGFALAPGERAVVVEDVLTTGASTREVIGVIEGCGASVVAIGAIVKRGRADLPYPVTALLELPLADYEPEKCPLCARGVPITEPGSRRSQAPDA